MGNNVANHGQLEASSVRGRFARAVQGAGVPCQFLVAVDACQQESWILEAYDSDQETLQVFILNGCVMPIPSWAGTCSTAMIGVVYADLTPTITHSECITLAARTPS